MTPISDKQEGLFPESRKKTLFLIDNRHCKNLKYNVKYVCYHFGVSGILFADRLYGYVYSSTNIAGKFLGI